MPLLIALAVAAAVFAFTILMLPFAIVFRYRAGTKRRRARSWIANINVVALLISATIVLVSAAVSNVWVPRAFVYASAGLAGGCVLGLLGLALTRWEAEGRVLHYTPSRVLVLAVSLIVAMRLAYSLWRAWQSWRSSADETAMLAAIGVPGMMAAGAVVVGYYLCYSTGVALRVAAQNRRRS